MAPVLGYWSLRGLASPIRLLLHHAGVEYEEKLYVWQGPPDYDRSNWLNEKFTLGLDFPNLPYYIDDEVKLTQSTAILRYLADKHQLMATETEEKTRMYLAEYQTIDFRMEFALLCYNQKFETEKENYLKALPDKLKSWSEFLGDKEWVAGKTLTYVDFMLYDTLQFIRALKDDCVEEFCNLKAYLDRMEALPNVSKYIQSDKFIRTPLFGPMATFGAK